MNFTNPAPLSIPSLVINLIIGILLSVGIASYYVRYGLSLSNRSLFAPILPILTLITILVISVVKSSLALSLGLVGALSIVRFRTAIKDPEELIFLFFAIGIGLGLGADQRIPTLVSVFIILGYLLIRSRLSFFNRNSHNVYLSIYSSDDDLSFNEINKMLLDILGEIDLRRLDSNTDDIQLTYYIKITEQDKLVLLMDSLKKRLPKSSISVVEQNNLMGS
jgi:hypothetical protein